ncbi:DUF3422 family protein [Azospira restricta]|uniref:DUF3422 domain-containing protein n=1 Tax=Azospira restricta TaxID=404405 RepID=A0A974PVZ1_9RHOO|nr:DUF3422 domain-containing protein [Azospira restricta]QRJ62241.1 DUF3422 domain-containing protein [Azospira restricta]
MTDLAHALNHPRRLALAGEIHSRPFLRIEAPARISHLAVHIDDGDASHDALLASLCTRFGVAAPVPGAQHFFHDFGHFRLKWERHTEFSTFTFVEPGEHGDDFRCCAIRHVPADWLAGLQAAVIVAAHIVAERGDALGTGDARLAALFPQPPLVGCRVLREGEIWTDFQIGPNGFSRFLLRDVGLRESQMGRLVQRICEIETYLMMALLALPLAREGAMLLDRIEEELTGLGNRMSELDIDGDAEQLLKDLSRLDAQLRADTFRAGYRFSAAQAYHRIVEARIGELREQRIEGVPTIGEFMERRLAPAMDSCVSVANRQEVLAARISRSNDMLRTRVNLAQERQTQCVLQRLSDSASLQLKMQQAVEGLSVVAISYYAVGLAAYALKSLNEWGLGIAADKVIGLLLPVVCVANWIGVRALRRRLHAPLRPAGGRFRVFGRWRAAAPLADGAAKEGA